ncbi:hypothetical protein ACHAWF_014310, partial [Thalassiosira exigua]
MMRASAATAARQCLRSDGRRRRLPPQLLPLSPSIHSPPPRFGDTQLIVAYCRAAGVLPSSSILSPFEAVHWGCGYGRSSSSTAKPSHESGASAASTSAATTDETEKKEATTAPPTPSKTSSTTTLVKKEPSIATKAADSVSWALKSLLALVAKTPGVLWYYLTHPKQLRIKLGELKESVKEEINHYWMGSKLLAADIRTARHILGRTLRGSTLSRRERKQLLRTVTDVFRLVPMSIFVLIPFMEFALPFALKIFPNMLPSTFQDSLKEEEKMKGELQMRISMAGFFQDTLTELAKEQKKVVQLKKDASDLCEDAESVLSKKEATATSFLEFQKKARTGKAIPADVIVEFAKYFKDDLTLDNMGRMQLINMCKYMNIPPYGNDNLLRFQLRHRIRLLKEDDQRILWEGINSLTKMELREACRERGMRSIGLSKDAYRKALQQWLDLSVQKNVPISLLVMSRTFFLREEMVSAEPKEAEDEGKETVSGLADAMSGIDKEVLNEIVLEMASSEEKAKNADLMKIQLEVLEHQNELIKEEQEERDAAAKEKEEKEKAEAAKEKEEKEIESEMEVELASTTGKTFVSSDVLTTPDGADLLPSKEAAGIGEAVEEESDEEEQTKLSPDEIDAISQLASPDPVHREREELERIKDKMQEDKQSESESEIDQGLSSDSSKVNDEKRKQAAEEMISDISPGEQLLTMKAQEEAADTVKELEEAIEKEARDVTIISERGDVKAKVVVEGHDEAVGDKKLQKAIDRLKSRVESMVGKIETHLDDVEVKIGSKFHLLDKDGDGVLTMEEMVRVLRTVLKRELTAEEALAIASDIDQNKDGVFSIAELSQWAETNTIVKLAEEGREKDVDDLITKRVADL